MKRALCVLAASWLLAGATGSLAADETAAPRTAPSPSLPAITFHTVAGHVFVSLDVKNVSLRDLLLEMCRYRKINIVFDPDVEGRVTARLVDVPWATAFSVIVKSNGYVIEWIGDIPRIHVP